LAPEVLELEPQRLRHRGLLGWGGLAHGKSQAAVLQGQRLNFPEERGPGQRNFA
jgi:hypothetical protein